MVCKVVLKPGAGKSPMHTACYRRCFVLSLVQQQPPGEAGSRATGEIYHHEFQPNLQKYVDKKKKFKSLTIEGNRPESKANRQWQVESW